MNKNDEEILVVLRKVLFDEETIAWQGATNDTRLIDIIMNVLGVNVFITRRGDAEQDEELKQPIPYMILKRGNEVFMYERLQGGGESRLHNKLSLGVGGHMNNLSSESFEEDLLFNTLRELNEEVDVQGYEVKPEDLRITTLINDDEDAVGRVHLGLLGVIELPETAEVVVKEKDQLKGTWVQLEELKNNKELFSRLENWSKIFVQNI